MVLLEQTARMTCIGFAAALLTTANECWEVVRIASPMRSRNFLAAVHLPIDLCIGRRMGTNERSPVFVAADWP